MNKKYFAKLAPREKIILSIGVMTASAALIIILLIEPLLKNYSTVLSDITRAREQIARIRTADKKIGVKQLDPGHAIIYMYNYMEGITVNSGVKMKNFQASGSQGTKGMANFQLKLGSNASTFARLLFIAENTVPSMAVSNFRISSQGGGTYESMRQLETVVSVNISTKRLGGTAFYADGTKFQALKRDPFAPYDSKVPVIETKPKTEVVIPGSWVMTAAMSDGDTDVLLFKKDSGTVKYAVSLKKGGAIALSWIKESVEIKIGQEQIVWALGDAKTEDIIPKMLKEEIIKGDTDKSPSSEVPAGIEKPVFPDRNAIGLTDEELKKLGIEKEAVTTNQPGRFRPPRRGR